MIIGNQPEFSCSFTWSFQ